MLKICVMLFLLLLDFLLQSICENEYMVIHGYVCSKSQFMNVVKSSRGICFCRSRRMICTLLKLLFPEMNRAKYCYLLKLEDFCSDSPYRKG